MCTYLHKINATYYFRRPVPAKLRAAVGRREYLISLRTKDRDEAKRLIPLHTLATEKALDAARAALAAPVDPRPVPAVEMRREEWEFQQEQAELASDHLYGLDEQAEELDAFLAANPAMAKLIDADKQGEVAFAVEAEKYRRASLGQNQAVDQGSDAKPAKGKGVYLDTDILDLWAAERGVVPKGKDTHKAVAQWFHDRVGRKSVELFTRQDVLAFKDRLLADKQTVPNINMKLSRLRTLLGWAFQNDYVPSNVADGISIKQADSGKNKRLPFSLSDLQAIYDSPVYVAGFRPVQGRGEAAYWLPLLGLYTGARLEELGQLRVSDVQKIEYPDNDGEMHSGWFLHITENTDAAGQENRLKNAGSERLIPVHPEMQRFGFLDYVAKLDNAGRVFPDLKANIYGRLTAKWGEWFGPYMRKVCGITDRRKVFHSFRHTFKDYARKTMPDGIQRQLMGHAGKDVADDYGSGFDHHALSVAMAAYKVPGLKLPKAAHTDTQETV